MDKQYIRLQNEEKDEYIYRICDLKQSIGTWNDVANIINQELDQDLTESAYRKKYQSYLKIYNSIKDKMNINCNEKHIQEKLIEIQKQTVKLRDTRNELNATIRSDARIESMFENIKDALEKYANQKPFLNIDNKISKKDNNNEGILCLGDIHIGLDSNNRINKFNTDIAINRMEQLAIETIDFVSKNDITDLYIVNLGDNISNILHTTLRLENRESVSEQLIIVAEMIAELINKLREYCNIFYGSIHGNHDRITMDKKESRNVDNYNFIIDWHLKTRFKECMDVNFIENEYMDGILCFDVNGHSICATHGDKDKPDKIVSDMILMNNKNFELLLMGHRHSFNIGEYHKRYVIQNPCFNGTDEYAFNIRKTSNPAQTLICVGEDNVIETIKVIQLK